MKLSCQVHLRGIQHSNHRNQALCSPLKTWLTSYWKIRFRRSSSKFWVKVLRLPLTLHDEVFFFRLLQNPTSKLDILTNARSPDYSRLTHSPKNDNGGGALKIHSVQFSTQVVSLWSSLWLTQHHIFCDHVDISQARVQGHLVLPGDDCNIDVCVSSPSGFSEDEGQDS